MRSRRSCGCRTLRARLAELLLEPVGNTPAEMRATMRKDAERWAPVVTAAEIMAMDRPRHHGKPRLEIKRTLRTSGHSSAEPETSARTGVGRSLPLVNTIGMVEVAASGARAGWGQRSRSPAHEFGGKGRESVAQRMPAKRRDS
jgi:hypothetical protein